MSRVDVIMPQMGESIAEGTVSRWLKQVGDEVKRDEPILEISTDKVDAEIPAPASGTLVEVKVEEGETVEVQTVVAVIDTEGGAAGDGAEKPAEEEKPAKDDKEKKEERDEGEREEGDSESGEAEEEEEKEARRPAASGGAEVATEAEERGGTAVADSGRDGGPETAEERLKRRSTPLVRKIAAEHDVDITRIEGSGHHGRVTKKDILEYLDRREKGEEPAAAQRPAASAAPGAATGAVSHPEVEAWPGDRVEPMSKIRKLTADHMIMSRRTSAHVTSFYEMDFTRVGKLRAAHKKEYESRGAKLTFLTFIVKVLADNLRRHPVVNSSVSGDNIIYRDQINIGIAVALEWGLIVPVIKNADDLSMIGLAKKIADLAERARSKKLSPDEVQKGTFTITNPGTFGGYMGTPIINQPQVAIFGVGAIEKRPKVITLEDGQDVIAIRTLGMMSMSYDHRVVDGADAERFLSDVKRDIENFAEGAL